MNDMTWNEFCELYYDTARKQAVTNVNKMRGKLGEFDPHVDVDYVIDSATLEALQKTYTSFDASRGTKITSFLSTIVHNEVVDELKRQTKEAGIKDDVENLKTIVREFSDDPSAEARARLIPRLMAAIEKLSPADQVILYNYLEDRSGYVTRSAQALQVSDNYISVRLFRILKKLPKLMEMSREDYIRFCAEYEGPVFANNRDVILGSLNISSARPVRKNPIFPSLDYGRMVEMFLAQCRDE